MQRRRFLFEHRSHDQPDSTPQSHDGMDTCPVCNIQLPSDDASRAAHIDSCLSEQQQASAGGGELAEGGERGGGEEEGDSDGESYEEYTWCNTTRIRTTSLLSPQTRASQSFGILCNNIFKCVSFSSFGKDRVFFNTLELQ